jgi:hypothetical protein
MAYTSARNTVVYCPRLKLNFFLSSGIQRSCVGNQRELSASWWMEGQIVQWHSVKQWWTKLNWCQGRKWQLKITAPKWNKHYNTYTHTYTKLYFRGNFILQQIIWKLKTCNVWITFIFMVRQCDTENQTVRSMPSRWNCPFLSSHSAFL